MNKRCNLQFLALLAAAAALVGMLTPACTTWRPIALKMGSTIAAAAKSARPIFGKWADAKTAACVKVWGAGTPGFLTCIAPTKSVLAQWFAVRNAIGDALIEAAQIILDNNGAGDWAAKLQTAACSMLGLVGQYKTELGMGADAATALGLVGLVACPGGAKAGQ